MPAWLCLQTIPDSWVRCHAEEFVDAWPWNRPRLAALHEVAQQLERLIVFGRFAPMSVHKDVRIDGDHGHFPP
jgi:hypothetical protein